MRVTVRVEAQLRERESVSESERVRVFFLYMGWVWIFVRESERVTRPVQPPPATDGTAPHRTEPPISELHRRCPV